MKKLLLLSLLALFPLSFIAAKNSEHYKRGAVNHLNSEADFDAIIKEGNVIIDFYSESCPPCRQLAPLLVELGQEFPNVLIVKLDVTKMRSISERYNIRSIPTLIFFKDGKQVDHVIGLLSKKKYVDLFNKAFAKN